MHRAAEYPRQLPTIGEKSFFNFLGVSTLLNRKLSSPIRFASPSTELAPRQEASRKIWRREIFPRRRTRRVPRIATHLVGDVTERVTYSFGLFKLTIQFAV